MADNSIQNEILQLVDKLNYYSRQYYVYDSPEISDYEYDMLLRRLKSLEDEHPEYIVDYSPTKRVGGEALSQFNSVTHKVPLKSLQDMFSFAELQDFDTRVRKSVDNPEYAVELKIDGLSVAIEYKDGVLVSGATRGDGNVGEDVTQNIKTINSVPLKLTKPIDIIVRGEVFMPKSSFNKLNNTRKEQNLQLFANPRNAAAGSLRQLDSDVTASRNLDIFIFNIQKCDSVSLNTHTESLDFLKELGFKVSPHYNCYRSITEVFNEIERFDKIRDTLPFDIDGAVVKVNNLTHREVLGETIKVPRWAAAYKYPPEQKPTILRDIIINVGRTGVLTPNAVFDTVSLAGTMVSKATLHNRCFIKDLDIRINDTVIVQKAGDIIPEIVRVDKSKRDGTQKVFEMPTCCPECSTPVVADSSGIMLRCPNPDCDAKIYRKIVHFVSKEAMDIEGLGPSVVNQLIENNLVKDCADLYYLKETDLLALEGFAKTSSVKLIESINKSKNGGLARVINALGIKNIGQKASKQLAKRFNDIDNIINATAEQIVEIEDFGLISAQSVVSFFNEQSNIEIIDKLKAAGVDMTYESEQNDNRFVGMTFVLSGGLESLSRNEASAIIESFGGKTSSSVSAKTSYLLMGDKPGSKAQKAQSLGIPIIYEDEFLQMIK